MIRRVVAVPSLWECLERAGVPREHRPAASLALVEFIRAHTTEMQAQTRDLLDGARHVESVERPHRWTGDQR